MKIIENKANGAEVNVNVEGAVIKTVSSPDTIKRIALDRGIIPQEVFVRVVFTYKGKEYTVSQKLRFLSKYGYEKLLNCQKTGEPIDLVVEPEKGFFYIDEHTSVEDLFVEKVNTTTHGASLTELMA